MKTKKLTRAEKEAQGQSKPPVSKYEKRKIKRALAAQTG